MGASAGGLDACRRVLAGVPDTTGLAFVVVMHLDPAQQSHIADFLAKVTPATVRQVAGGERVEANNVYVIAPATALTIRHGVLHVAAQEAPRYRVKPIDDFFIALAADQGDRAVGIVLSGTGNDGAAGLKAIHEAGGLCLVQEPSTAEYDGMPDNAVQTGVTDAVLPPEDMGKVLIEYALPTHVRPPPKAPERPAVEVAKGPGGFEGILALLGKQYGVDFSDYKTGTLARRTARRMGLQQILDWDHYLGFLRDHPEELAALYGDVLIDVTRFFRDRTAWEYLEREIVPQLLETHESDAPVRVWSAGCATGEEAYGLAMVFIEQIEKRGGAQRLQVFGSDLSHETLSVARRGVYPVQIADDIAPERLRRFFNRTGEQYQVDRSLRDLVTFAAHNLLADPPFANLDLIACRNVLIYLEPHAQERLLELFHFALRPKGVLWLGSSETIGRRSDLYETVAGAHRVYQPIQTTRAARRIMPRWVSVRPPVPEMAPLPPDLPPRRPSLTRMLERFVLESLATPAVAINRSFEILHFFGRTEPYLKQPSGELRMDLLSWVRPGLYGRLRAGLLEAVNENKAVTVTDLRIERDGGSARIEAVIQPVAATGVEGVFLVSFRDIPPPREPVGAPEQGASDESLARDLEQELRDTRLELQSTVEQLDTANEEYRASHEELLSLNEELQSSNEELEMSKEELQSLNEELTTVNRQLEERNEELRLLSADLSNLLVSADVPVLFLDRHFRIRRFTPACARLMRIVETDVGRAIDHVKLEVRDDNLLADAERVLSQLTPIETELRADNGRWYLRRIVAYRTETDYIDGVCITFQDITAQKDAAQESEQARAFAEAIVRSSPTSMLVLDEHLRVVSANRAFYETFKVGAESTIGHNVFALGNRQWDIPRLRELLGQVLTKQEEIRAYDVEHEFESIGRRAMRLSATILPRPEGRILISIEDVTDLRRAEEVARLRAEELAREHRRKDEFLGMLGHELRNPLTALAAGLAILERGQSSPEQIAAMKRQSARMSALLDQLLDVGRVIFGKLRLEQTPLDLTDTARVAVESVEPMIKSAGQDLILSLPDPGAVVVFGDPLRLSQVVENLLANASKFTPAGGRIWLTVAAVDDHVRISVRDTGAGMEPEFLGHAFDLFTQGPSQLDRAKGGLGLGLPLVRTVVEMHGGSVTASSDGVGKGSEFVVTLPRLRSAQAMRARNVRPERSLPRRKILVVDDEPDAASLLADLLTLEGQDVRIAGDGPAALEAAGSFRPDVVLLDLGLPDMDGYAVGARLREAHRDAVVVALTGYRKDDERLAAAGFDAHLLKPPDLEALLDLLPEGGAVDQKLGKRS